MVGRFDGVSVSGTDDAFVGNDNGCVRCHVRPDAVEDLVLVPVTLVLVAAVVVVLLVPRTGWR